MARFEFKLPDIGEGVSEGEVVEWFVSVGDSVAEDDPMVEVMTDKATVTIGAPVSGTVEALRVEVGATAQVGDVLVVLQTETGDAASGEQKAVDEQDAAPAATAVGDIREGLPGTTGFGGKSDHVPRADRQASAPALSGHYEERPRAAPATRRLARQLGVDLRRVPPSDSSGRVTQADVRAFASGGSGVARSVEPRGDHRKPFVGLRRKIAERMQQSKNTAAHFTFVEECRVDRLMSLRTKLQTEAPSQGAQLTFLPFVIKAVTRALRACPDLNVHLDEQQQQIVYHGDIHIGVATATEQGLVVPVIQHADQLSVYELGRQITRLSQGARERSLKSSELSGSTFTVTSLGKQGGLLATPVLNHPEVGILGVHQIKRRPVVEGDSIAIGHVMMLSLSFDHRLVDGHVGAAFAYQVIEMLEEPALLFVNRS